MMREEIFLSNRLSGKSMMLLDLEQNFNTQSKTLQEVQVNPSSKETLHQEVTLIIVLNLIQAIMARIEDQGVVILTMPKMKLQVVRDIET